MSTPPFIPLLHCPLPPALISAHAGLGDTRYSACYWDNAAHAWTVWDGVTPDAEPLMRAWQVCLHDPLMRAYLSGFDLGGPARDAAHALLLDHRRAQLSIGSVDAVLAWLRQAAWSEVVPTRLAKLFSDEDRHRITVQGLSQKDRILALATVTGWHTPHAPTEATHATNAWAPNIECSPK